MPFNKTTSQFIIKSKSVHKNKYDYSHSKYINNSTKIEIICKTHGSFWQTPANHSMGRGCKKCSKYTTKYFIARAKKVHGSKYDYSFTEYKGTHVNVAIFCKQHGLFFANPQSHINGVNCPKCANENKCITHFIDKSKKVHGNEYDYKLCDYKKSSIPVKIICRIHGVFMQSPISHLMGKKCRKCAWVNIKYTTDEFLKEATKIHKNIYDYSKVNYKHSLKPIKIKCKTHGIFKQTPSSHINGQHGCPDCNRGMRFGKNVYCKNKKKTIFYVLYIPAEDFFKIGITQKTIKQRYIHSKIPYKYKVFFSFKSECECMWELECLLKKKFKKYQYKPHKYFKGMTECFSSKIKHSLNNILCETNLKSNKSRKAMLNKLIK